MAEDVDRRSDAAIPEPAALPEPAAELAPAGARGALVIRDKVVDQVARRAALDVPGVVVGRSGAFGTLLGQGTPRVETTVAVGSVRAVVHIAVEWPRPLAEVAAAVRDTVRQQLTATTGLVVDRVDVRVDSDLEAPEETTRRVQ